MKWSVFHSFKAGITNAISSFKFKKTIFSFVLVNIFVTFTQYMRIHFLLINPIITCIRPSITISNCHSLEVVGRGSETQLQVGENLNYLI